MYPETIGMISLNHYSHEAECLRIYSRVSSVGVVAAAICEPQRKPRGGCISDYDVTTCNEHDISQREANPAPNHYPPVNQ